MAYTQQENLGGQMQDRQFSIFTTANIVGAGLGGLLTWQGTGLVHLTGPMWSSLWFLQSFTIVAGIVIGVLLTIRWKGLSALDRIQLRVSYRMRKLSGNDAIQPEAPTMAPTQRTMASLYRNGKVVARPYVPSSEDGAAS
ncbi:MAG TPA: hypothetical protein VF897_13605 [Roseiflexaceae bacterium]